jgi:hypothetical protein
VHCDGTRAGDLAKSSDISHRLPRAPIIGGLVQLATQIRLRSNL